MIFGLSAVACVAIAAVTLTAVAQIMRIIRTDKDYQARKKKN